MRFNPSLGVLLLAVALAACGGGGSQNSTATTPAPAAVTPPVTVTPSPDTSATPPPATPPKTGTYTWSTALFGAGGYISGIVYHPTVQGLVYIRTDVGGVYRRDPGSSTWIPLNDDLSRDDNQLEGPESLSVDPNDSQ